MAEQTYAEPNQVLDAAEEEGGTTTIRQGTEARAKPSNASEEGVGGS